MSRIGNLPIIIPSDVTVDIDGANVSVKGPLGNLEAVLRPEVKVEKSDSEVIVKAKNKTPVARSMHGLMRTIIYNMVNGVKTGWEKKLELVGVGYRAQLQGDKVVLNVGYSHPVEITAPEGVKFNVADNTKITVTGIDKYTVGQTAATIRAVKPPEPYQGKGIRYAGERVKRKAGKAGKVGGK